MFKDIPMKSLIYFLFFISIINFSHAQSWLCVSAENGLFVRDKPNMASNTVIKLNYGTKVNVIQKTDLNMDVLDNGEKISGQWVKINAYVNFYNIEGYVFNGYLTEEELKPRYNITFDDLEVLVEDLVIMNHNLGLNKIQSDTIKYTVELGDTPEEKMLYIKPFIHYKKVEVFQSYTTSMTVMNEGPHCDLVNWKHYSSDWVPIRLKGNNTFQICSYSEEDRDVFVDVQIDELVKAVGTRCGNSYAELVKDIQSITQYPIGISISTIYLKIIVTDLENNTIEKIIAFEFPLGC
jgi:hypothetical protein